MEKIVLRHKRLSKIGDSYGIIVDKAYIRNGQIEHKEEYTVTLDLEKKEVEEDENKGELRTVTA